MNMLFLKRLVRRVVPGIALLIVCYLNFVAFYSIGYETIYSAHADLGVAISLWCIIAISDCFIILYWVLLFKTGPGKSPHMRAFDLYNTRRQLSSRRFEEVVQTLGNQPQPQQQAPNLQHFEMESFEQQQSQLAIPPKYFFCDSNGFPFWCSNCESIKLPRSSHLKDLGYCILKFDHYCLWVGTVIGQDNFGYFLKFVLWCMVTFIVGLVYLSKYLDVHDGRFINKNFIFGYILTGVLLIFLILLLGVSVWYVTVNMTTLDDMNRKNAKNYSRWIKRNKTGLRKKPRVEDGKRYINYCYDDSTGDRMVVEYDITAHHPFDFGFRNNWIQLWLYGNSAKVKDYGAQKNWLFCKSWVVFLVPVVDILVSSRNKGAACSGPEYDDWSDSLGPHFEKHVNECINSGRAYPPVYLPA